jgi:hypothetical protein
VYCQDCIEDWAFRKDKDTCPMCRGSITKDNQRLDSFYLGDDKEVLDAAIKRLNNILLE